MAGYSVNRIPAQQRTFFPDVPNLWATDGSNPLLSSVALEKYPGEGSLQTKLLLGESVSYNIATGGVHGLSSLTQTTSSDTGDTISVFVWVRTDTPIVVNFSLYLLYPQSVVASAPFASTSRSLSVTSAEWTLLRLYDLPVVADDTYNYQIGFNVTVDDIEGGPDATVNISHPVIYGTLDFINNPSIIQLMSTIPEFIRDQDANAEPLPYQLIRFLEMASIHTGEIAGLVNSFIYQDISEGYDGSNPATQSVLVDPIAANKEYLPWLAQFSGTQIINPTTGFTPWANIPATWQGIDLIDSVDTTQDSVEWSALQDYNTEPAGLEDFLRWQASNGFYGIRSGTQRAIIKSVERVLTGTQYVGYEVVEPFSWTIKITTLKSETPDAALMNIGDPVPEILELIEPTRPLGYKVIHELI